MELVKGDPIVEYCDRNNLRIQDRLELFAQVCNAVQHAHTKGIIHRDIKPSNILVSIQDGKPHTKVIDFGIAKATANRLTEKTLFTEHRQLIGTPEYMSPEQAEGSMDIDTRTDVYSLGVLLYELLTGTTPFGSKELRSAAYGEIQRIIREVEPPKPSTRISQCTGTIASVAAHRHTEPRKLGLIVRGELDWIVMKGRSEKDRRRRYETASRTRHGRVRRHLTGEAIRAASPSRHIHNQKVRHPSQRVGGGGRRRRRRSGAGPRGDHLAGSGRGDPAATWPAARRPTRSPPRPSRSGGPTSCNESPTFRGRCSRRWTRPPRVSGSRKMSGPASTPFCPSQPCPTSGPLSWDHLWASGAA